ncbi:MAG: hypothetical protein HZB39_10480 [Planctomycetes bacterium]|nr:hypothetical protein [Planctomycetota bacterium]
MVRTLALIAIAAGLAPAQEVLREIRRFPVDAEPVVAADLAPAGDRYALWREDGVIAVRDADRDTAIAELAGPPAEGGAALVFSDDGRAIAVADADEFRAWSLDPSPARIAVELVPEALRTAILERRAKLGNARPLAAEDGLLVLRTSRGEARRLLWSRVRRLAVLADGEHTRSLNEPIAAPVALAFSADARWLVAVRERSFLICAIEPDGERPTVVPHALASRMPARAAPAHTGPEVVVVDRGGVYRVHAPSGRRVSVRDLSASAWGNVRDLRVSPRDGELLVLDETNAWRCAPEGDQPRILARASAVDWFAGGESTVVLSRDRLSAATHVSFSGPLAPAPLRARDPYVAVASIPGSARILALGATELLVLDAHGVRPDLEIPLHATAIVRVDARRAVLTHRHHLLVVDHRDGELVQDLPFGLHAIWSAAASLDGRRIAVAVRGELRVYEFDDPRARREPGSAK